MLKNRDILNIFRNSAKHEYIIILVSNTILRKGEKD